ncbi:hypothetical protein FB451DRAFT_763297 [Mycena latifolia]|nr:hypothetical protein FB451DRAFT_763297 [Mycena latifolia]
MFSCKLILTALAFAAVSSAAPSKPTPRAAPTITVCTEVDPTDGCVAIPIVSGGCIDFTVPGGLSFLNKAVSAAQVPDGFVCVFFEDAGCINGGTSNDDVAVLTSGTWNMLMVQGIAGTQSFNDLTSSISCSPL